MKMVELGEVAAIDRESIIPSGIRTGTKYLGLENVFSDGTALPVEVQNGELLSNKFVFGPNHLLYGKLRPYLNKITLPDFDGICSTDIIPILPDGNKLDKRYLFYYLRTPWMIETAVKACSGANLPRVDPKLLAKFKIPLPPLPTQRRIAAVLDKAQALVANDKRTLALYDQLAKSLFLEMFGDPVRNERGWEVVELGDVVESIENGWSPNCESYPRSTPDEWAVLKLGSVTYRQFDAKENKVLPEKEVGRPDLEVQMGDLLVTRKNTKELVGAAAYVFETEPRLMIPDLIFRLVTKSNKVDKMYLWMLLNEDGFQKNVQQLASGSASSMPNISKAKLKELPIPLPPLNAQQKYKKAALALRDRRTVIDVSLRNSESLFGSLLQRAFAGGF